MQKITTCLWFDNQVEEAVNFYASVFKNSKIGRILRYDSASAEASGQPEGSILTIEFELMGREFIALNGGPIFKFNESVSLVVNCDSQEEVDYYWNALTANGGVESQCGWLKDKYGLSWQITPTRLVDLINDKDTAKAHRAMQAMLEMRKIDIQTIEDAANAK
jgi:predicted 3-demethylubiquinone-9 3-methyltransferase (glyoxalase superfamily)